MIGKFLHVGLEVEDIDKAIAFYEKLGFTLDKRFDKPEPKARAAHIKKADGSTIELWQFMDKTHPQVEYIRQHIAFESDDLDRDIDKMISAGSTLVIPKTKGVTMTYAFVRDRSGNYIEVGQK